MNTPLDFFVCADGRMLNPVHVAWSLAAVRAGLTFANVSRFQSRYRLLYAVIGAGMVAALFIR